MAGEEQALEGLRRSEEKLRAYAEERGLVLSVDALWPGAPAPEQQVGPVRHAVWSLAGRFPGGAIGRLRHQAIFGKTMGMNVAGQHTIMVSKLPESVGYIPLLNLRPSDFGAGLFVWAGDKRARQEAKFESTELGRKYVIETAAGQDQNWLYQLFPPTFINWLASSTPPDFGFRLDGGVFTCEAPEYRGQATSLTGEVEPTYLDMLSEASGKVASRIRDEVLEEIGTGKEGSPASAAAAAEAAKPRYGFLIRSILKLAGGEGDSGVAAYAAERGMAVTPPAEFHSSHIALPLPGTATDVASGTLPGSERQGHIAWITFSSSVDVEKEYVAVIADFDHKLPSAWIDEEDIGVPGFDAEVPPAALEAARSEGFGLSSGGRCACVYRRSGRHTEKAGVDEFAAKAAAILTHFRPTS
jgi:hypothetical protein